MTIDIVANVQLTVGGPTMIQSTSSHAVGATETISIELQPGASDQEVLIQPGPASAVMLLALQAETGDQSISYKPATPAAPITLNGAHIYNGPTMVALLGATPTSLFFSSTNANPITVTIIVGRNP